MKDDMALLERFYKSIYRIRRVEEEIVEMYSTDKIKSPVHLSIGQEAVSVAVCEALRGDDIVFGTYRGHAMYLAKGGDLNKMIAELYGKTTGCTKGKGGSMHLADPKNGVMGTSAIVGTSIPLAVGYAYGLMLQDTDSIAVTFFGDGAVDEGAFHESINFAALKELPVLFICENNHYAIHSHHLTRHRSDNIHKRAETYGLFSHRIEDNDIFSIYEFVKTYSEKIRAKNIGPVFLECITSRWLEHVGPGEDFCLDYRKREEVEKWKQKDQLKVLRQHLNINKLKEIESEIESEIKDAFEFAEQSPFPESSALYEDVFMEV